MRSSYRGVQLAMSIALVAACESQPPTDVTAPPGIWPQPSVTTVIYNGQEYLAIPDTDSPSDYFAPMAQIAGQSVSWFNDNISALGVVDVRGAKREGFARLYVGDVLKTEKDLTATQGLFEVTVNNINANLAYASPACGVEARYHIKVRGLTTTLGVNFSVSPLSISWGPVTIESPYAENSKFATQYGCNTSAEREEEWPYEEAMEECNIEEGDFCPPPPPEGECLVLITYNVNTGEVYSVDVLYCY